MSQTKQNPNPPKPRSYRLRLSRQLLSLNSPTPSVTEPLNRTQSSPSRISALRDNLEASPGVRGRPEYGISGPLELPRPPRPILIRRPLPRPHLISKATQAYPDSAAISQAPNTLITPRPKPSCEPFEPHRDQVRRDGITRSRQCPARSLACYTLCYHVELVIGWGKRLRQTYINNTTEGY